MNRSLGLVAIVVRDYDEAIRFYADSLGFELIEDTYIPDQDKRRVIVAPAGSNSLRLLLARAAGAGLLRMPRHDERDESSTEVHGCSRMAIRAASSFARNLKG
jgi:catechol 2,3-dioxygenase-like lactoylglutathione lyase family enzyme